MDILIQAAQFILSLSILIVLHEMGHFVPAKLFKTKVEKFYLFFDPKFSLFKKKIGETEYGIGWLPLGGYVKIAGMIDESMDKEQMNRPAEDWEFRSKPAWQRLIIMLGGVFVNLVLAVMIYAMILMVWGDKYIPNSSLKDGIWVPNTYGETLGLKTGDKILSIGGKDVRESRFTNIKEEILHASGAENNSIVVDRAGEEVTVHLPVDFIEQFTQHKQEGFIIAHRIPFIIGRISDTTLNAKSGLMANDWVKSIGNQEVKYFDQAKTILESYKGTTQAIVVMRKDKKSEEWSEVSLTAQISKAGLLEVGVGQMGFSDLVKLDIYDFKIDQYSFFAAIPAGYNKAVEKLEGYVRQFKLIFNPDTGAYKGVGGFVSIGSLFPPVWDWEIFWEMTALLSVVLAFMNILPIPALDGGHAMFLFYEIITQRKPSEKFMEYAQMGGMGLLFALMLYANGNDILKLFLK